MIPPANFIGLAVLLTCDVCAGEQDFTNDAGRTCACHHCGRTGYKRHIVDAAAFLAAMAHADPTTRYNAVVAAVNATSATFGACPPALSLLAGTLDFHVAKPPTPLAA